MGPRSLVKPECLGYCGPTDAGRSWRSVVLEDFRKLRSLGTRGVGLEDAGN